MEGRKQFTFYRSYYEALSKLPRNQRLAVLEAVIGYALDGKAPEGLDAVQEMAFVLIRPTLDAGWKKAEAGAVGGKISKRKKISKGEKEEEKEKENETEIENEIEMEDDSLCLPGFAAFWNLYPVKLGKEKAEEVWRKRRPDPKAACDGVKKWLQTNQWKRDNGRFIPRAAKFLEERHYEHLPGDHITLGASGVLGQAELEAIRSVMEG